MSFLKKLFGGGGAPGESPAEAVDGQEIEHKGFTIRATPFKAEGQFQTAGTITREIDGEVKEHKFIRADRFASLDDAMSLSLRKGQQLVDEQGERLFN
ncbi:MAG: hypothetical protein EPN45_13885 [Rhizobiaceae bacterium]|nr:MAG: hypothetical protein EPN45_13885 [Rhizobiaceae bacterium]